MSFSFRNLFQRDASSEERGRMPDPAVGNGYHGGGGGRLNSPSMQPAFPFSQQPQASPFQVNGSPLFKTAGQEPVAAPPINGTQGVSPFSVGGVTSTGTPLTVGDVIGQLPPELVRAGALPLEQPLALPPGLVESVLRGGQPALPVFELYRVCPALFQAPVSPQDPRSVPLPLAKLPGLIAKAREGQGGQPAGAVPGASPFAPAGSPFAAVPGASPFAAMGGGTAAGSPFAMAGGAAAPAPNPPAPQGQGGFSMSPFAAVNGAPQGQGQAALQQPAAGSPFGFAKSETAAAVPQGASPFAQAQGASAPGSLTSLFTPKSSETSSRPAMGGTSFGAPPASAGVAAAGGSPFAQAQPQAPAAGGASPFGMAAAPAASPFGMAPAAEPAASPFAAATAPSASPFGSAATPGASPFGSEAPAPTAAPAFSPFGASLGAAQSQPSAAAAPASPFANVAPSTPLGSGLPFGQPGAATPAAGGASPFGMPQNAAPMPSPFGTPSAAAAPGASAGTVKLSFASTLYGLSAEDLGFNPAMVPAWIVTQLPASTLKEQISRGPVVMELGALIDGITDVGFRNTLTAAKRAQQVKLPQNEVFHALTGGAPAASTGPLGAFSAAAKAAAPQQSPAPAPAGGGASAFVIQPGAPAGQINRIEPASAAPAGGGFSVSTIMPKEGAFGTSPPVAEPSTSFQPPQQHAPEQPASFTGFGKPPSGGMVNPFAPPAGVAPSAPVEAPAPAAPFSFGAAPAAPVANPFAALQQPAPSSAPLFPPAPAAAPAPATASAPLQPLPGAFKPMLSGAMPSGMSAAAAVPSSSMFGGAVAKPFDPFASTAPAASTPSVAARPPTEAGLSSAQLLGQSAFGAPPAHSQLPAFSTPPKLDAKVLENTLADGFSSPFAVPGGTPSSEPKAAAVVPLFSEPASPPPAAAPASFASATGSRPLFSETLRSAPPAATPAPAQQPAPTPPAAESKPQSSGARHSFLGLAPLDTQTDQLLLRALLATEENLTPQRVIELLASLPGLSACVCLHGSQTLGYAQPGKAGAADFQRQAADIARQLRSLAPLIGIEGAETFTLNAGGRLLTFCFPGSATVGVLHDVEPSEGLRDKVTLIARELVRMLG